jgi:predicted kinase
MRSVKLRIERRVDRVAPLLIVLVGLPGSGKTTLSRWLQREIGITIVSRDDIRAAMFPACLYTDREKRAAFEAMQGALEVSLALGIDVCTDGMAFSSASDLKEVTAIAPRVGADLVVFDCQCPVEVAQRRVEADRSTVFPDRTAQLVADVAARFSSLPEIVIPIDMTQPVDQIGRQVRSHLSRWR